MAAQGARKATSKGKMLDQEQVILQFNQMRQEQRNVMAKIGELDQDHNEHRYGSYKIYSLEVPNQIFFRHHLS